MSKLWVVIPAAGESKRYKDAGYNTPKPFLNIEFKGVTQTMLKHVIDSIPGRSKILSDHVVIGIPYGSDSAYLNLNSNPGFRLIKRTFGQADTVRQIIVDLPTDDSVLVLDSDMILRAEDLEKLIELLQVYDMTVAVTETFDPNSSRVDQVPFPTYFVEKQPISQYGIVGARAFKNIGLLQQALEEIFLKELISTGEVYLSKALNSYPGTKFALVIKDYTDFGTPERLKNAGAKIIL